MDNKFAAKSKTTAVSDEKQPGPKSSHSNMAVSSVEYNHKIDGKSNAVNMSGGSDGESGGVTGSGSGRVGHASQTTADCSPTHDGRHGHGSSAKRKTSDNLYLDVSTPVAPSSSQVIHVNAQKPKKGSFQITGVMIRKQLEMDQVDHAEDADSIGDEFDETNTEDLSSEIMDTSKMTDIEQDPSSEDTVQSLVVEDLQREAKSVPHNLPQTKDETSSDTKPNLSETPQASPDSKEENTDPNFGENRFRIVKVSNERFLRGRWTCVDYQDSERTQREKSNEDLGSGNSSAASSVHYVPGVDDPSKNPLSNLQGDNVSGPTGSSEAQPGQSMTQTQITNGDYSAQSLTSNTQVAVSSEQTGAHEKSSSIVQSASSVSKPISSQHSQNPTASYTTPSSTSGEAPVSKSTSQLPTQDYSASSHQDYLKQGQTNTLPSTQSIPQQQQASQPQAPLTASGQEFQSGVPKSTTQADSSLGDISNTSLQPGTSSTNIADFGSGSATVTGSGAQSNNPSPSDSNIQGSDFHGPPDGIYISPADDQLSTVSADDDRALDVNVMKPFMMQVGLTQPLLEMVQTMQHPLAGQRDPEDESGASTVAIDNKIEQAMDLVKSHLMFAVREEVLVLKEQIKELLEKNSQLEYENNVLRKGATQETLAKLTQSNQGPSQSSSS